MALQPHSVKRLLIANRGEIAVRVARTAADMGVQTVMVTARDDEGTTHPDHGDTVCELRGTGVSAYLDAADVMSAAIDTGCDAIHPGYGFLSENAELAELCSDNGVTFVGPGPDSLRLFGDKARARALAEDCAVPVLPGTEAGIDLEQAEAFWASLPAGMGVMLKAVSGGGGRGTRAVRKPADLAEAFDRCQSEALSAFGDSTLYVEAMMAPGRHIEIQIIGDGTGQVRALGDRDCSVQRRHQKLLEIAPAPALTDELRSRLRSYATAMAAAVRYRGVGTWEFLVSPHDPGPDQEVRFLEVNPRLQVEHTVTEEVWDVDLVRAQLDIAGGRSLADLDLPDPEGGDTPRGCAVQARILAEVMDESGISRPGAGVVGALGFPAGRGIRVDHAIREGLKPDPRFDPLLAKVVVSHRRGDLATALGTLQRELDRTELGELQTNLGLLSAIAEHPLVTSALATTSFVDEHRADLLQRARVKDDSRSGRGGRVAATPGPASVTEVAPLDEGDEAIRASLNGVVVHVSVETGDEVRAGEKVAVLEAMKMEHVITSPISGIVSSVLVMAGHVVAVDQPLLVLTHADVGSTEVEALERDLDLVRDDLQEVLERRDRLLDHRRPEAVARRHAQGRRTARENVDDLVDDGTFVEYGGLSIAAQRARRDYEDLVERTPADGMVSGVGEIDGVLCATFSYDYTVLAGTQGTQNHRKKDRLLDIAERNGMPVVFFAEGGGGRPGDTDYAIASGLDVTTFTSLARLSGAVPLVGITGGRCFAGNAALLGVCDVIIATEGSNIGMGGPVMIEGGGLGTFAPEEVGPLATQWANGVVDIRVEDDAAAVAVARQYLSYFTGPADDWEEPDQRILRHVVPENRKQVYDVREAVHAIADVGSVLELRGGWAEGMITSLARVEGRPIGIVANNPRHLGGAIDAPAADKASRFMGLCDAFSIPLLFLCDTPGFMVGPEAEVTATVRHFGRMFVNGANANVPFGTIVMRKAYGLGAQAMAGGGFKAPLFTVAWPTAELGPMGLEGAVRLAHRREMEAITDPAERSAYFDAAVEEMYRLGSALNVAEQFELDDVIDPVESRRWVTSLLRKPRPKAGQRPHVDAW